MRKWIGALVMCLAIAAAGYSQTSAEDVPTIDLRNTGNVYTAVRNKFFDFFSFSLFFFDQNIVSVGAAFYATPTFWLGLDAGFTKRTEPDIYLMNVNIETGFLFGKGRNVPIIVSRFGEVSTRRPYTYWGWGFIQRFNFPVSYVPEAYRTANWQVGVFIGTEGGTIPIFTRLVIYFDFIHIATVRPDFTLLIGLKY